MLSPKDLARIVKNKVETKIRKGELDARFYASYYILSYGEIHPVYKWGVKEEEEVRRSPYIYAYVDVGVSTNLDFFLFEINYLGRFTVENLVDAYLRKMGFTVEHYAVYPSAPPAPNLKYFIYTEVKFNGHTPEYLVVNIYDINTLARTLHIPQIAEQRLGSRPREIASGEFSDTYEIVVYKQHLLAGYTYLAVLRILYNYYVRHDKD
ncbi:MAG: hypothetical protein OWT28_04810, partial [Firmicutes bacterium]|nr:hypothetical protein [Bacillota bacterium]